MSEESGQERTEQPTSKRRKDFREKGQVAQSREVNTAAMLTFSLGLWFFYAPIFWNNLSEVLVDLLGVSASYEVTSASVINLAIHVLQQMGMLLLPIFLLALVIGFFASYLQIGLLFTAKPLQPDLAKLDPIKGAAKFISKRSAVDAFKSILKVALVGVVAYRVVLNEFDEALFLIDMDVSETIRYIGKVALQVLWKSCGILILLAAIDFWYTRWEMEQKMKMTKQEVKEENKESEGDPMVKGRIRSIQMQMARRRMMAEVPNADVIITNPTHLSIAISYKRGEMTAPVIIAKGADHLAMRIREIAKEHRVPMVENVPVARALYKVDVGREIPEDMFKAVAEILAYVYSLKGRR